MKKHCSPCIIVILEQVYWGVNEFVKFKFRFSQNESNVTFVAFPPDRSFALRIKIDHQQLSKLYNYTMFNPILYFERTIGYLQNSSLREDILAYLLNTEGQYLCLVDVQQQ